MKPTLGPTAVQQAGSHLLEDLDSLVEQVTVRVWQAVPGYNDILVDRRVLEQQVRPNITDILEFMRSGREIDDEDHRRLESLGRSRALQGVPLAAMIQSFRTAERVVIDAFCVFCIRAAFNSAEQRSGIQAIGAILDKVEQATLDAYLQTQHHLERDLNSTLAVLVSTLVDGTVVDRVDVDAQARLVGANPSIAYQCLALSVVAPPLADSTGTEVEWDAGNPTPRLTRLRRHLVVRLIEAGAPAPIAGLREDALILLVPATGRDPLATVQRAIDRRQYRAEVVAGAGDIYPSLFEARASCHEALATLEVALRQHRRREVLLYADAVLDVMLLRNGDTSRRLIAGCIGPLEAHPLLDETIRHYINLSLSSQATADRLVVHVNTIAYRLRRVRELTGYDVRNPADAASFFLALRARDLLSSTPRASSAR